MLTPEQQDAEAAAVTAAVDGLFAEIDSQVAAGATSAHGKRTGIRLFSAVRDRLQETIGEDLAELPGGAPLEYNGMKLFYSTSWVEDLSWQDR